MLGRNLARDSLALHFGVGILMDGVLRGGSLVVTGTAFGTSSYGYIMGSVECSVGGSGLDSVATMVVCFGGGTACTIGDGRVCSAADGTLKVGGTCTLGGGRGGTINNGTCC
eukprot:13186571-Ditylum_brightwellii.AAC.1